MYTCMFILCIRLIPVRFPMQCDASMTLDGLCSQIRINMISSIADSQNLSQPAH